MEKVGGLSLGLVRVAALSAVCLHVDHTECVCYDHQFASGLTDDRMLFLNRTESYDPRKWTVSFFVSLY